MRELKALSQGEQKEFLEACQARYEGFVSKGLSLDMTRGKPSSAQLDLSRGLLALPGVDDFKTEDGVDVRNYGGLDGFKEGKKLFAELLEVSPEEILIGGNASLQLMHDTVVQALLHGVPGGNKPWIREKTTFLCPTPGYDRHFAICEHMKIDMIPVEMDENGPDMDTVERLVKEDASIKGMWCVPKYSNPSGIVYSDEVVERLASMKTAAADFRIWWDNAYVVHHLNGTIAPLKNMLEACKAAGHPNRVYMFASTSKISFAGAGIAAMAASGENLANTRRHMSKQTIGLDKVNLLRHLRYFKGLDGILAQMEKHAEIMKPKFDAIQEIFAEELGGRGVCTWSKPTGGYFVSLDVLDGCAAEIVGLASKAGVKLTGAGATFPYGRDPRDRNIRLAPSLPPLDEIKIAMEVVSVCIQIASLRKLLQ